MIRRAEPGDAAVLSALCWAAKEHWGYPPEWMEIWRVELTLTPGYIAREPVFVAEGREGIVGFFGLRLDEVRSHLEHLWVKPAHLGRGCGRHLFEAAVRLARALGAEVMHIKADPNAEKFYLKMGAVRAGAEEYVMSGGHRRVLPLLAYPLSSRGSGT
ncbi:MAG: GNAT family N-acetyltransferase [Candidatus Didemnitutus sp.]|nr:GNAT family N-acetyltransferase [Candidatus Didemnitutus sp.]